MGWFPQIPCPNTESMVALRPRPSLDWCLPTHPSSCESTAAASPGWCIKSKLPVKWRTKKLPTSCSFPILSHPFPSFPILSHPFCIKIAFSSMFIVLQRFSWHSISAFWALLVLRNSKNLHLVGIFWPAMLRMVPAQKAITQMKILWTRCGVASYVTPIFRLVTVSGTLKHHQIPSGNYIIYPYHIWGSVFNI